jgi:hypothetical protein
LEYLRDAGVLFSVDRFQKWMIFLPRIQNWQRIIFARIPNLISQKDAPKNLVPRLFDEVAIDFVANPGKFVSVVATANCVPNRVDQRGVNAPAEHARLHVLDVTEIPVPVSKVVHRSAKGHLSLPVIQFHARARAYFNYSRMFLDDLWRIVDASWG